MLNHHEIELRVRYNECDPMGFLHHANYFTYFEIGRTELLRAGGRKLSQNGGGRDAGRGGQGRMPLPSPRPL